MDLQTEEIKEKEIGIAVSHYHQKLGPQFAAIAFDFTIFDKLAQYDILQDSISSRSKDLALFISTKNGTKYTIRIKKIKIFDPNARGRVQRYALIILYPSETNEDYFKIDEIVEDITEKLTNGLSIRQPLNAWHTLLNDQYGKIEKNDDLKIVKRFQRIAHPQIDLL
ncbi:hypothetical protein [Candidatus Harpocratesius sp.]